MPKLQILFSVAISVMPVSVDVCRVVLVIFMIGSCFVLNRMCSIVDMHFVVSLIIQCDGSAVNVVVKWSL